MNEQSTTDARKCYKCQGKPVSYWMGNGWLCQHCVPERDMPHARVYTAMRPYELRCDDAEGLLAGALGNARTIAWVEEALNAGDVPKTVENIHGVKVCDPLARVRWLVDRVQVLESLPEREADLPDELALLRMYRKRIHEELDMLGIPATRDTLDRFKLFLKEYLALEKRVESAKAALRM